MQRMSFRPYMELQFKAFRCGCSFYLLLIRNRTHAISGPALHRVLGIWQCVLAWPDHVCTGSDGVAYSRPVGIQCVAHHCNQVALCRIGTGQDTGMPVLEAICKAVDGFTTDEDMVTPFSLEQYSGWDLCCMY